MDENKAVKPDPVATIYKTHDYSIFKNLLGNRGVKAKRTSKIVNSILRVGYIVPSPVIVNERMEVIDGQGRIEACKQLNLPIYYVIAKGASIDECMAMNMGQTNWSTSDYVGSYAMMGNGNYIRFRDIAERYPQFTSAEIYGVCANSITINGHSTKVLKNGELELSEDDYKRAISILDYLVEALDVLNAIPGSSRVKKTALAWVVSNTRCDRKRLLTRLAAEYPKMSPVVETLPTLYLSELSDIYNRKLSKQNCLYFDALYKQSLRS